MLTVWKYVYICDQTFWLMIYVEKVNDSLECCMKNLYIENQTINKLDNAIQIQKSNY